MEEVIAVSEWQDIDYRYPSDIPCSASPRLLIIMPRGDMRPVSFMIRNCDQPVAAEEISDIYFTVKLDFNITDYLFQKRLSAGDIDLIDDGSYQFVIEPEDTDALKFGRYVFDIEIVGPDIKQTFIGDLVLTNEATHKSNEADNG